MPAVATVDPARATLCEGLSLLHSPEWRWLSNAVMEGRCAFWIGSAVSKDRFPDLWELLKGLLDSLHAAAAAEKTDGPHHECLRRILALAASPELAASPPGEWADDRRDLVLAILCSNYAKVLQILQGCEEAGRPIWDSSELAQCYGRAVEPDADHHLLALLIAEGLAREVITTNWDALIENAYRGLNAPPWLTVVAQRCEVLDAPAPRIFKVHGCARKASEDPGHYLPWLVATSGAILRWEGSKEWEVFREELRASIRRHPALFIGLSGQDNNLKKAFLETADAFLEKEVAGRPWIAFARDQSGFDQEEILRAIYRGKYRPELAEQSVLRLYSKPLLGSLYVFCLLQKARVLIDGERDGEREEAIQALEALRRRVVEYYDSISDPDSRWRTLARELPAFLVRLFGLYRDIRLTAPPAYCPVAPGTLDAIRQSLPNLQFLALHRLVAVGAALLAGQANRRWSLLPVLEGAADRGQLRLLAGPFDLRAFILLRSDRGACELIQNELVDWRNAEDTLIFYIGSAPTTSRDETDTGTAADPRPSVPRTAGDGAAAAPLAASASRLWRRRSPARAMPRVSVRHWPIEVGLDTYFYDIALSLPFADWLQQQIPLGDPGDG